MATAAISSTFEIVLSGDLTGPANFTTTRALTIVGIVATNTNSGATTFDLTAAAVRVTAGANGLTGVGIVQAQSVAGPDNFVGVLAANSNVATGAAMIAIGGASTVSKVRLQCIGNPAQAITVT